jgi:Tfp pilus assembly protein PilN
MKQINLLPIEVRQRAVNQQIVPYLIGSVVIASAAAGLVWFVLHQSIASTKQNIADLQNEQQLEAAAVAKAQQAGAASGDLQNRITLLNGLAKKDIDWQKTFTYIGNLTPKDIFLSGYSIGTATAGITFQATGVAPSNLSFANFMESLRESKFVVKPTVSGFTYDPLKQTVTFTVSWQVPAAQIAYTQ